MKVHQRSDDGLRARQDLDDAVAWRYQNLLAAGFAPALAAAVATEPGYDLHAVLQLIDRGCPPDLAARILEPLPNEVRG